MKTLPGTQVTAEDVVTALFKSSVCCQPAVFDEEYYVAYGTVRVTYRGLQVIAPVVTLGTEDLTKCAYWAAEEVSDELGQHWLTAALQLPEGSLDEEYANFGVFEAWVNGQFVPVCKLVERPYPLANKPGYSHLAQTRWVATAV